MSVLHKEELQELIDHTNDICVSLFMPTHPIRLEQQRADPLLLRNLIDEARAAIGRFSPLMRHPDIEQLLQPATQILHQNGDFWKHQAAGLAIFLGREFSRVYRLPLDFEPLVRVGGRFYIRPLLPLLTGDGRFYLLALSHNQVRLFQATQDNIEELDLQGIPTSLDEVLAYDDPEKELQFRGGASAPGAAGGRSTIFYSVDVPTNYKKKSLLRYSQQIDAGLQRYVRHETAPLVLACVDYLFAIYQRANSYPHLFPECVSGSPDRLNTNELHQKAWALVKPTFKQTRQEAVAQFWAQLKQGRAATTIRLIITAAFQGRIETLFTAAAAQQWGFFNPHTGEVHLDEHPTPNSQDLLNLAAIYTLTNGGTVYVLRPDELPEGIKQAAVFRY